MFLSVPETRVHGERGELGRQSTGEVGKGTATALSQRLSWNHAKPK